MRDLYENCIKRNQIYCEILERQKAQGELSPRDTLCFICCFCHHHTSPIYITSILPYRLATLALISVIRCPIPHTPLRALLILAYRGCWLLDWCVTVWSSCTLQWQHDCLHRRCLHTPCTEYAATHVDRCCCLHTPCTPCGAAHAYRCRCHHTPCSDCGVSLLFAQVRAFIPARHHN